MFSHSSELLAKIESDLTAQSTRGEALARLRALGLSDFGLFLISLPDATYPKLSALLPRMAEAEVQRNWTGNSGAFLLTQTLDFVRSAAYNYSEISGKPLSDAKILDFGCGYGRISRMMYFFTEEENYFGVDPWDRSIEICKNDGLTTNFAVSDYLPTDLPVGDARFDFIFAFSVFTHLSERATRAGISTVAKYLTADGILLITTREIEYWAQHFKETAPQQRAHCEESHDAGGFAFVPHSRETVDGDVTYGDTSMTVAWFHAQFPDLKIVKQDRSLNDPYQSYWFVQKR
ncbi:class I SAM-dependent methyltransferase [Falsihalocynthiibacter arcticus]|uniref:Methyltransferase domain-containing protein n=1 Tax=Falsihalocynthiibacter arcticus TaxID=1579316 RepID=A0A126V4T6_9RHOB|nr:class I SAM-dependent methyltransferase [Falsihalocynthiibacter arcticus]AML52719.1 hypothetical protein RC74_16910 [Falsihalocynthiibacter arcticus]